MTEIATKPKGFRAKFGLGPKTETSRKLIKKSLEFNDGENRSAFEQSEYRTLRAASDPNASENALSRPNASSRRHSLFTLSRKDDQHLEKVPSGPKPRRKLSKAPQNASNSEVLDKDTGERKDLTDMLHAFSYMETEDLEIEIEKSTAFEYDSFRIDGSHLLSRLPVDIWALVADYLSPLDVAHLTLTSRTAYHLLIRILNPLLLNPSNRQHRQIFLLAMSSKLPDHLFCFPCTTWHLRTHPGSESLKPSSVLNPLFICPNSTSNILPAPRLRLAEGRTLPFSFVQLAKRHWAYGPAHGIPAHSLARRWKDTESPWRHETKYHIHTNGHALFRIKSTVFVSPSFTPAAKRLLLFSRADYTPYFSVCAHWRFGILTSIPKCALDHIPVPQLNNLARLRTQKAPGPVTLCSTCQPMRRCPQCPTEYLVEIKLVEDRTVKSSGVERFKLALEVTRWSDLGPGESPEDREWAAVTGGGTIDGQGEAYDSFKEIGRRSVSGIFESSFQETVPGQRIISMRPGRETETGTRKEDEDEWY